MGKDIEKFLTEKFTDRLRESMKDKGYKQIDLAKLVGIDKGAISHYLSGSYEPKSDKIYILSKVLGVNPVWLMGTDAPKYVQQPVEEEKTVLASSDISDEINGVLNKLMKQPEGLMFCGKPMDDETKHLLKLSLEHAMKLAIEMDKNKQSE
jgi:transcriptional regulator with XRE-family HTH domain